MKRPLWKRLFLLTEYYHMLYYNYIYSLIKIDISTLKNNSQNTPKKVNKIGHQRKTVLSIFVTSICDLRCVYCYGGDCHLQDDKINPLPAMIDINFVKRAVLDFFGKYKEREIRFFGMGEPTIAFPLVKEIRDWAFKITNGSCRFELQTNGYFSSTVAEWVAENIDIVWISCDGPQDIQNSYRPTKEGLPSASVVERNIRFLASKDLTVGCRATIGAKNIRRQTEMIDYFAGLGVKAILADPICAPVKDDKEDTLEEIDLIQYAEDFLIARRLAEERNIFYGSIFMVNFDEPTEYFCRACIPYPHLTTDGYVTCCDMAFSGTNPHMKDLVYGKYIPEEDRIIYDENAIKKIQSRKASNMLYCKDCEVLYNCAGACLGEALNEKGSMFDIRPNICAAIKFLAKRMPLNQGLYPYLHS